MKVLLVAWLLLYGVYGAIIAKADPPENAQQLMIPYPSICTPSMAEMIAALTEDYAVHISMTFEETPITGVVVVHNPNTGTAAILHLREERTCLVFSGMHLQMFERPEGMAPPKEQVEEFEES